MDSRYADMLRRRREAILARMERALAASGRPLGAASLIAVSKTVGPDEVLAAIDAGFSYFAENRPQELVRKCDALAPQLADGSVRMDMIGNLQTNKINAVLGRAGLIHSVSSEHLAQNISARAERRILAGAGAVQRVLLEVNVSGEASKSGFTPGELDEAIDRIAALPGIELAGLMTMAPKGDLAAAYRTFAGLRDLQDRLSPRVGGALTELSCGMSGDFEAALEEGSTLVRLGRVVFDPDYELE